MNLPPLPELDARTIAAIELFDPHYQPGIRPMNERIAKLVREYQSAIVKQSAAAAQVDNLLDDLRIAREANEVAVEEHRVALKALDVALWKHGIFADDMTDNPTQPTQPL